MISRMLVLLVCLFSGLATGEELRLSILHFNDVYQYNPIDGKGGLARIATRAAAERARNPHTLVTFGGDLLSPSVASALTRGQHMIELMNALGVDAAVLGNHEFDYGPEVLKQRLSESRFPWLAANLRQKTSGALFPGTRAYILHELGGTKIAVIGIITDQTVRSSRPGAEQVFDEPVSFAIAQAERLRKDGVADIVVALTHLDVADDRKIARSGKVDLVLGGHDHDAMSEVVAGVPIFKASSEARNLAVATVVVDSVGKKIDRVEWALETVEGEPHSTLQAIVARYDGVIEKALGVTIGETSTPLDARTATVRMNESTMGNMVADAFRDMLSADIAIVNGGGMRLDAVVPPGPITRKDIKRLLPLENHVYKLEISGADLKALFDNMAGFLGKGRRGRGAGEYPHVSGMRIVLNPEQKPGLRVAQLEVAGKSVTPGQKYSLAVSDYLASGRGNYDLLKDQLRLLSEDVAPLETAIVMDFIEKRKTLRYELEKRVVLEK